MWYAGLAAGFTIFAVIALGVHIANGSLDDSLASYMVLATPFICAGLAVYIVWQWAKSRAYQKFNQTRFHHPILYMLTSKEFGLTQFNNTVAISWTKVDECFDLPTVICFVIDREIFPIPKRYFLSGDHLKRFRSFVRDRAVTVTRIGRESSQISFEGQVFLDQDMLNDAASAAHAVPSVLVTTDSAGAPLAVPVNNSHDLDALETLLKDIASGEDKVEVTFDFKDSKDSSSASNSFLTQNSSLVQPGCMVKCHYEFDEMQKIDRMLFFRDGFARISLIYLALVVYAVAMPVLLVPGLDLDDIAKFTLISMPLALPFIFFHSLYLLDKRKAALKEFLELDQPVEVTLGETICTVKTTRSLIHFGWNYFTACLSTADHYICCLPRGAVIIPKRAIQNRAEAAYIEQLLSSSIRNYQEFK